MTKTNPPRFAVFIWGQEYRGPFDSQATKNHRIWSAQAKSPWEPFTSASAITIFVVFIFGCYLMHAIPYIPVHAIPKSWASAPIYPMRSHAISCMLSHASLRYPVLSRACYPMLIPCYHVHTTPRSWGKCRYWSNAILKQNLTIPTRTRPTVTEKSTISKYWLTDIFWKTNVTFWI